MPRTLLIDDESAARCDLRAKLSAHPEITIVGEAATVNSARELLVNAEYELVFLDVQLIGGDAFQLVPHVRPGAKIIFATGHDQYALRAFEINALDYLLKPISPERLASSLRRICNPPMDKGSEEPSAIAPGAVLRPDDIIYLDSGSSARFVPVGDICFIAARDNYSEVRLTDGTKVLLRKTLKSWADSLPRSRFMQVHRTLIVNLARIVGYKRDRDERTLLFFEGIAEPVSASRSRWSELQTRLKELHPAP